MKPFVPLGTPIAVVAPCGVYDPARLAAGIDIVKAAGHTIEPFPDMLRPERYLAAPDDVRLEQLVEALTSPNYGAVWIARGGYGLTRLIERLPYGELPDRPILGFSDVTALFAALSGHTQLIHAPVIHSLPITDAPSRFQLFDMLTSGLGERLDGETWVQGSAEGPLVGGNLTLFASLAGTRFQPDWRGKIVLLEDIGEPPYRLDRMLQQMRSAGLFTDVQGIALGEFTGCAPPDGANWTLKDVLLDHLGSLDIPIVADLPVGHGSRNRAFVWNQPARIQNSRLIWGSLLDRS